MPDLMDDNLGDWRIDTVCTLAEDVGEHKAGDPVRLMSSGKHRKHKFLCFVTPSVSAMCLNVAIDAAAKAEAIRPKLVLTEAKSPFGKKVLQVQDSHLAELYYFFEQAIVAATMSFQALEAFANATIGRRGPATVEVRRKAGVTEHYRTADAERRLPTEDKFAQVLPKIFSVDSPKGGKTWTHFKDLKFVRDETVHVKSRSIYTRHQQQETTLLFDFLSTDIRTYPMSAVKVIEYYFPKDKPRWLTYARRNIQRDERTNVTVTSAL
ncbi:MAG: hypothetical protein ACHP8B_12230 [Terriglobales bacterium]